MNLRANTRLDTVARHFTVGSFPKAQGGKLLKDDQSCKGVQDYLADKHVYSQIRNRPGRYWPNQITRNFWR